MVVLEVAAAGGASALGSLTRRCPYRLTAEVSLHPEGGSVARPRARHLSTQAHPKRIADAAPSAEGWKRFRFGSYDPPAHDPSSARELRQRGSDTARWGRLWD